MREISDGIWHWTALHEGIGIDVSSYWIERAGIVLDPMVPPDDGLEWWDDRDVQPQQIVLTIGLHWRHCEQFRDRWDIPVRVPRAALDRYEGTDREAAPYEWGEEVGPGVMAVEVGAIAPDEAALHITHGDGAVAIADGVIRGPAGSPLGFVPDELMDEPEKVKAGLRDAFRGLLTREWDTMLLAHGDPIVGEAQKALRDFLDD